MQILQPKWLNEMPEGIGKLRAENRFYFRIWCIYASEVGTMYELAHLIGINPNTLFSQSRSHNVRGATDLTKNAIERLLGPAFVPPRCIPDRRFKDVR